MLVIKYTPCIYAFCEIIEIWNLLDEGTVVTETRWRVNLMLVSLHITKYFKKNIFLIFSLFSRYKEKSRSLSSVESVLEKTKQKTDTAISHVLRFRF